MGKKYCAKKTRSKRINRQHGITLLEVMLALVIFALSGLSVMKAASETLNNQAYLDDKTFALWVASNHLAEQRLEKNWPGESWKKDSEEFAGITWYIRCKLVPTANDSFKALDVEVSRTEDGSAIAYIRTYVAK